MTRENKNLLVAQNASSFDLYKSGSVSAGTIGLITPYASTPTNGNDVIVGDANDNIINALDGNDRVSGLAGNDQLFGGDGNDILEGGEGADSLNGGAGTDTASYENSASAVVVSLSNNSGTGGDASGDTFAGIENLMGSVNADVLTGTAGANVLSGLAGADTLNGFGGNDVLRGGAGADILNGGDGTDRADYSQSSAAVMVDLSRTTQQGGDAQGDQLTSVESTTGSAFADELKGDDLNNRLQGGGGDDRLEGGLGRDTLTGGTGNDTFVYDIMDGEDTITDFLSTDILNLTGFFAGTTNADVLAMASQIGSDVVFNFDASNSLTLENATLSDIVNLTIETGPTAQPTEGDDVLTGDATVNVINGLGGNDRIYGYAGNDQLTGGTGNDLIIGGAGADIINGGLDIDTASYVTSSQAVIINLSTNVASGGDAAGDTLNDIENLVGTDFNDRLTGDDNRNILTGGDGDDILNGLTGDDVLRGGAGADRLNGGDGADAADYSQSNAAVTIDLEANSASGGDADGDEFISIENIYGSDFGDNLTGSGSDNLLRGGDGDDSLIGGLGNDTLSGGAGADEFVFSLTDGADLVTDFTAADSLKFSGLITGTTIAQVMATASQIGSNVVFDFGAGNKVTLRDVTLSDLVNITLDRSVDVIGTSGNDTLEGDSIGNVLRGLEGNDTLKGNGGDDMLVGGDGNDILEGGAGADILVGQGGNDTADYRNSDAAITVNLFNGTFTGGHAEGDSQSGIENVFGSAFADEITGTGAANRLSGFNGSDILEGRSGNDILIGGLGADTLDGGGGIDTASYIDSTEGVTVDIALNEGIGGTAAGDTYINIENVTGSDFRDIIKGNDQRNVIDDGDGNDAVEGAGGNDLFRAGDGRDRIDGGEGIDTVDFSQSDDGVIVNLTTSVGEGGYAQGDVYVDIERVTGSVFNDRLTGNDADNLLRGGDGNDILRGGNGRDTLIGGTGNDTFSYLRRTGQDTITDFTLGDIVELRGFFDIATYTDVMGLAMEVGSDVVITFEEDHTLTLLGVQLADLTASSFSIVPPDTSGSNTATTGNDILTGDNNDNFIDGLAGNDTIYGLGGDDHLAGGSGNDVLAGGAGADLLRGQTGTDTADYRDSAAGVMIDLVAGTATGGDAEGDTLSSIENIYGSAFADMLTGNGLANQLWGFDGDDTLEGGAGNDLLVGGKGGDILNGGAGEDTISYLDSDAGVTIDLTAGTASGGDAEGDSFTSIENVIGSDFRDTITGTDGRNIITDGGARDIIDAMGGNDIIRNGAGPDQIDGGAGIDTVDYRYSTAAVTVNLFGDIYTGGFAEGDTLTNIERIFGSEHHDRLTGDAGDNLLRGNGGNDVLRGGAGNDILTGGDGLDTYVFGKGAGFDTVTDYVLTEKLDFSNWNFTSVDEAIALASQSGNDTIFNFDSDNALLLKDFDVTALDPTVILI